MPPSLKLTSVVKTLRLKGTSDYPRKITGAFSLNVGGVELHGLRVFEGHIGTRDLGVSRVIWVECRLDDWDLEKLFPSNDEFVITLCGETGDVEFIVQRITSEVEASVDLSSFPKWVRGQASIDGVEDSVFEVFEPDSNRKRVYLTGDSLIMRRIALQVQTQGSCDMILTELPAKP